MKTSQKKRSIKKLLWEAWCLVSLVGIYPRHIEPSLIYERKKTLTFKNLPRSFSGLKILALSDLHFTEETLTPFYQKLIRKAEALRPDLILFLGDFINYGTVFNKPALVDLLSSFSAPMGCYACLGNHDYSTYVTLDPKGNLTPTKKHEEALSKGFRKLFRKSPFNPMSRHQNKAIPPNPALLECLKEASIKVLENQSLQIKSDDSFITLSGVGDRFLGRDHGELPLDSETFNIVMAHNPDSAWELLEKGADFTLSGHTHGGQISLPWMREKFLHQEYPGWIKGIKTKGSRLGYISTGISSPMPFRFLCPPEITLFTLKTKT